MNKGRQFEELVLLVERVVHNLPGVKVQHNVKLPTRYGVERQIDILITECRGRFVYKTIIECKNTTSKVTANTVGAFKELLESVSAHQGIIVSSSGFQTGALKSAKEKNIFLYKLSKSNEFEQLLTQYYFHQFDLKHTSKEVTIKFKERKSINQKVTLYTEVFSTKLNRNVTLVDIAQNYLNRNKEALVNNIYDAMSHPSLAQITDGITTFNINFPSPLIFTHDTIDTEIIGFDAVIETKLYSNPCRLTNISEYYDAVKLDKYALIFDIEYQGSTFKWIEKQ